jgi:hypothetical protein
VEAGLPPEKAKGAAVGAAGASAKRKRPPQRDADGDEEGEMDEAALVEDCGECTNCLDKRKFGGPGLKKQKCKAPVPAGSRAAVSTAASPSAPSSAVALEAKAWAGAAEGGRPQRGGGKRRSYAELDEWE